MDTVSRLLDEIRSQRLEMDEMKKRMQLMDQTITKLTKQESTKIKGPATHAEKGQSIPTKNIFSISVSDGRDLGVIINREFDRYKHTFPISLTVTCTNPKVVYTFDTPVVIPDRCTLTLIASNYKHQYLSSCFPKPSKDEIPKDFNSLRNSTKILFKNARRLVYPAHKNPKDNYYGSQLYYMFKIGAYSTLRIQGLHMTIDSQLKKKPFLYKNRKKIYEPGFITLSGKCFCNCVIRDCTVICDEKSFINGHSHGLSSVLLGHTIFESLEEEEKAVEDFYPVTVNRGSCWAGHEVKVSVYDCELRGKYCLKKEVTEGTDRLVYLSQYLFKRPVK